MVESRGKVTLRSGEQVEIGIVRAPDAEWQDRLLRLLLHKGDLWMWQNDQVLAAETGIEVSFYVLHRDGQPFANIMIAAYSSAGIFGHVWTEPEDRGQGAASLLIELALSDFAARDGKALFLGTGYGSTAYKLYERFGFHSIEPLSGQMEFYTTSKADFERVYFAPGVAQIEPLDWRHWAGSSALFLGDFPGQMRAASLQLIGRQITEGGFLALLEREQRQGDHRARVLIQPTTGAVVGFATWDAHPLWDELYLLDLYCHPNYWHQADDLLAALTPPDAARLIAYADERDPYKPDILRKHGFTQTAVLPKRIGVLDVLVFEK